MFEVVKFVNYGVFEPECRRIERARKDQKRTKYANKGQKMAGRHT